MYARRKHPIFATNLKKMINIQFPDGSKRTYEKGSTPLVIAQSISEGLARNVLSVQFKQRVIEPSTPLEEDGQIILYTWNDKEGKTAFWHSSAHILAQALLDLYPNCKLTIGPAIENGFYYDVDSVSYTHLTLPTTPYV